MNNDSISFVKLLISKGADRFVQYSYRKGEVPVEIGSILQYALDPNSLRNVYLKYLIF